MKQLLLISALAFIFCGFVPLKNPVPHSPGQKKKLSDIQQRLLQLALQDHDHMNDVGSTTVSHFLGLPDSARNCGGLCFKVARERVDRAFKEVTGKPLYDWIPQTISTKYLTHRQVFDWTWNINTQDNDIWRSIPDLRACGSAGAIQLAGLGQIKNITQIWKGELLPGAVVQVFVYVSDFEKVRYGIDNPRSYDNLSSYGHSFIFLEYVKNEHGDIIGMKVADQGFLNKITVNKAAFHIWWGANISDPE